MSTNDMSKWVPPWDDPHTPVTLDGIDIAEWRELRKLIETHCGPDGTLSFRLRRMMAVPLGTHPNLVTPTPPSESSAVVRVSMEDCERAFHSETEVFDAEFTSEQSKSMTDREIALARYRAGIAAVRALCLASKPVGGERFVRAALALRGHVTDPEHCCAPEWTKVIEFDRAFLAMRGSEPELTAEQAAKLYEEAKADAVPFTREKVEQFMRNVLVTPAPADPRGEAKRKTWSCYSCKADNEDIPEAELCWSCGANRPRTKAPAPSGTGTTERCPALGAIVAIIEEFDATTAFQRGLKERAQAQIAAVREHWNRSAPVTPPATEGSHRCRCVHAMCDHLPADVRGVRRCSACPCSNYVEASQPAPDSGEVENVARGLYEAHNKAFAWHLPPWPCVTGSHREAWIATASFALTLRPRAPERDIDEMIRSFRLCFDENRSPMTITYAESVVRAILTDHVTARAEALNMHPKTARTPPSDRDAALEAKNLDDTADMLEFNLPLGEVDPYMRGRIDTLRSVARALKSRSEAKGSGE